MMKPDDWIVLIGILAAPTVSIVSLVLNTRREKRQQERDDRLRKEQQVREDNLREQTRALTPHIELHIACHFFGPIKGDYVAEFILTLINRGSVKHVISNITLTVLGLTEDKKVEFWVEDPPRVSFPVPILHKVNVIPKGNTIHIEPGVTLEMPFATRISESNKYILAKANIQYGGESRHGVERIFELPSGEHVQGERPA